MLRRDAAAPSLMTVAAAPTGAVKRAPLRVEITRFTRRSGAVLLLRKPDKECDTIH